MPCTRPLVGFQGTNGQVFVGNYSKDQPMIQVPCGKCPACRLDRARSWAIRCVHEAQMHESNSFITLTYSPENLPESGSLVPEHFTQFRKRLRERARYEGKQMRYFHCGEYGDSTRRPHYHALIFGYDFPDKKLLSLKNGYRLESSEILNKTWGKGHTSIGTVTFQSAGYCARYSLKKISDDHAINKGDHYVNKETGEILQPEYNTMSRRPGIGKAWFERYWRDLYPGDHVVIEGKKQPIPRYYDKLMEIKDPTLMEEIKAKRIDTAKARLNLEDQTVTRREAIETCINARMRRLPRPLG